MACGYEAPHGPAHLPATVEISSLVVKVTNNDHQDWRNVRVRVK